jgi:predicted lipoprotein with Yx(FWY)xxD motif
MIREPLALAVLSAALLASTAPSAQGLGGAKVEVRETKPFGRYLTDADGRALYMFTADKPGESTCYDKCAEAWPPLITSETPRKGEAVNAAMVDTIKRRDGRLQVTYNFMPLYYYVKDQGAGSTAGQDVKGGGGEWYLVSPEGKKIEGGR